MGQTDGLYVKYHSSFRDITVTKDSLSATKTTYSYGQMPSSVPTGSSVDKFSKRLSQAELDSLLRIITSEEFWQMKEEYGVSEEQRFYPYEIFVRYGDREKKILYRSSPLSADEPPEVFRQLEKYLIELCE